MILKCYNHYPLSARRGGHTYLYPFNKNMTRCGRIMGRFILCLFAFWLARASTASAGLAMGGSTLRISRDRESIDLSPYVYYLEDADDTMTIDEIRTIENSGRWKRNTETTINVGYTTSAFWFKVDIMMDNPANVDRVIEIDYPVLDEIDVFMVSATGEIQYFRMGDKQPFDERPVRLRSFVFPVQLASGDPLKFFLRVKSSSSIQLPLTLCHRDRLVTNHLNESMLLGICLGIMLVIIIYNMFVYVSVRELSYLFYVFFLASMTLLLSGIRGIGYQYFWPNSLHWNDQSIIIGLAGAVFFGSLFIRDFTNLQGNRPLFSKLLLGLALVAAMIALFSFILPYRVMIQSVIFLALVIIPGGIAIGFIRVRDGDIPARYFLLAWSAMMIGGVILAANKFNLIPRNLFTENAVVYGMGLQAILLSFALAERLNLEKQNSLDAQMNALKQERIARKAQESALVIQKRANELLEERVRERTIELELLNKKLESLSITDGLTGIKNRRYFNTVYPKEFRRAMRDKTPLAFLLIDIDYFKNFNDTYGHLNGDDCLKMVASAIDREIRRFGDMAFRYGGEEFAVLLPNTTEEGALLIAEKIRSRIEAMKFTFESQNASVTISIGLSICIPAKSMPENQLVNQADMALYQAKASGRNQVATYTPPYTGSGSSTQCS